MTFSAFLTPATVVRVCALTLVCWSAPALAQGQSPAQATPAQASPAPATQAKPLVEVWKDPSCGCCADWVTHMQAHGFETRVHDVGNGAARARLGVPLALGSCHTARVGGYAVEGHVPAVDVQRLLKDKPQAVGLAVPGMPIGSPGMDGPAYGGRQDAYDTLLVQKGGKTTVFQAHNR